MTDDLTALRRMAEANARIAEEVGNTSGSISFAPQFVLSPAGSLGARRGGDRTCESGSRKGQPRAAGDASRSADTRGCHARRSRYREGEER